MFGKKKFPLRYGEKIDSFESFIDSKQFHYELRKYDNVISFHFKQQLENEDIYEIVAAFTNNETICEIFVQDFLFVECEDIKELLIEINNINNDCIFGNFYLMDNQVIIKYPIDLNFQYSNELIASMLVTINELVLKNYDRLINAIK